MYVMPELLGVFLRLIPLSTLPLFLQEILSVNGVFYLIALKQNGIPNIRRIMKDNHNFDSEVIDRFVQSFVSNSIQYTTLTTMQS